MTQLLRSQGIAVVTIGRGPASDVQWDPAHEILDPSALEGVDAVVNLAGAPIDVRWTRKHRREIRDSRVRSTRLLCRVLADLAPKPRVLVSGSAVGFYGNRGDAVLTEDSAGGEGFLADVVREWEASTEGATRAGIRVVHARTGVVIAGNGGMLRRILTPFKLGLGGPIGGGAQWMSWIALHDHVRAMQFALSHALSGAVNLVAPHPVTNAEFTRAFAQAISRPAVIPVPSVGLRMVYGQMAKETILTSQRVVPARLTAASFTFEAPAIDGALRQELAAPRR